MIFSLKYENDWDHYMSRILETLGDRKILCLEGEMGAGKTTFCKKFCKFLGSNNTVQSPTFSLIHKYRIIDTNPIQYIYHIDLFRLASLQEILEIGIEEIIDSGSVCIIEWPQLLYPLIDSYAIMTISIVENTLRRVNFN